MKAILFGGGLALLISLLGTRVRDPALHPARATASRSATTAPPATTPSAARPPWAALVIIASVGASATSLPS